MYVALVQMWEKDNGLFVICINEKTIAEMQFQITGNTITINTIRKFASEYSSEIEPILFNALVDYARENYLIVTPGDPVIQQLLSANSEAYEDIWHEAHNL